MRLFTRALTAGLLSTLLAACGIGEGNGIVSIEIVEFDASTDFEIRADQCEGNLIALLATFTDGQRTVYTHRADWSVTGNAALNELKNGLDLTTAVEVLPDGASAGDTITVTADYLSLSTSKTITVNSNAIQSMQLEPAVLALITGESQIINTVLTLDDGSTVLNPVRGLSFSVPDADAAFTANGFNGSGQAILSTTTTVSNGSPASATEASMNFSCNRDAANTNSVAIKTAKAHATHYAADSSDITLEISSNFYGSGTAAANANANPLPTDVLRTANAVLKFNGSSASRVVTTSGFTTWSASNTAFTDCNDSNSSCSATVAAGFIKTDASTTGLTNISASYQIDENTTITAQNPLIINVSALKYDSPAFVMKDESGNTIDTTATPAVDMASNTGRILQFIAQLLDENNNDTPFEFPVAVSFTVDSADEDKIIASASTLAALGETAASVTVTVDSSNIAGSFTNNIPSFVANVHIDAPTGIFIDSNNDGAEDSTANIADNETRQLRSFLAFAGKNAVLRTGATVWSTSDNSAAVVGNTTNTGLVTVLDSSKPVTITGTHTFTDHTGTTSTQTASITINPPPP